MFFTEKLQSVRECCRVLQSVTECYSVLQSVTMCYRMLQSVTECYKDKSSASILTNFWACFIDFHAQFLYLSTIVVILAVHLKKATSACIFSATFLLLLNGDERIRHRHQKSFSSQQLCLRCKRRTENKCVAATGNWIRICNRTILD